MVEAANAFAGQGAVVLDIGGDVGALIVDVPDGMDGVEIEIRPAGTDADSGHGHAGHSPADHEHIQHAHGHHPHVAVVRRPTPAGPVPSAVFPELVEGDYELYLRTDSDPVVQLWVSIRGGEISYADWPG